MSLIFHFMPGFRRAPIWAACTTAVWDTLRLATFEPCWFGQATPANDHYAITAADGKLGRVNFPTGRYYSSSVSYAVNTLPKSPLSFDIMLFRWDEGLSLASRKLLIVVVTDVTSHTLVDDIFRLLWQLLNFSFKLHFSSTRCSISHAEIIYVWFN